jgi:hypothetical protein
MDPLRPHIAEALDLGPQAPPLCLSLDNAATLSDDGYHVLENGYTVFDDGAIHIATLTQLPRATPEMVDWWIWWHATDTPRYKLWYPRAHLYAEWAGSTVDPQSSYRERYIGGTSFVDEYVGNAVGELAIQFVEPKEFGFDDDDLDPDRATAICARVGLSRAPIDWGYLVHHVRRVDGGCELRSRFWMGGRYVAARGAATLDGELAPVADAARGLGEAQAKAMVVHCSREMNHLARFLPDIFEDFQRNQ